MHPLKLHAAGRMEEDKDEGPGLPDMTMMPLITEAAINDNLRRRYDDMQYYRGKAFGTLPPHVFALAESAYSSLQNGEKNQSVVISGESGAGKTETTKLILQYLCAAGGQASWAEQQILEANTVLEAFGNAKTVRNDNSSRFGKFVEVRLDHRGGIKGAVLRDFLLERARITGPAPRETNYHVFYQLVEGARHNTELKNILRLRDGVQFKYLRPEDEEVVRGARAAGGGEQGRLEALQLALTVLQVAPHMCEGLFKDIDGERTSLAPEDSEAVEAVASLLGLPLSTAQRNRHAMARALYSRTFAWLVRHVNSCSAPGRDARRALGVLDIFGFENFASNSLEQLCINYANEKLHMFFNNYVFALEQEIYRQEGIKYSQIQFTDNAACLELLEKPPRSLLKLLSEQCHMPKGSDGAYLTNIQGEFGEHQSFVKGSRRKWEEEFGVQHYAGAVTYSVHGFVDKNRDTQQDAFIDHLSRSHNPFVRELADYVHDLAPPPQDISLSSPGATSTTQRGTSKGRPTVVDTFRAQLQSLVDMLQVTDVWYVRCIKPNENKVAGKYNEQLVMEQLRYLGMNEIVRIRRDGYPVHAPAPHFAARYRCLLPHPRPQQPDVAAIMSLVNAPRDDWQIGHTKIFMRSSVHGPLEAKRTALLQSSALLIQKWYKGTKARSQFVQWRQAAVVLQAAWRGWVERAHFLRLRRAALTLQRHLRGAFAREVATALREMKRVNQEIKLREERNSMAEQLRVVARSGDRADSVNLDNLFDFLADLENVLAEEMNELTKNTDVQRKPDGAPSEFLPPPPPPMSLPLQSILQPATPVNNSLTNGINGSHDEMTSSMNGRIPNGEMSSSLIMPPPPSSEPLMDGSPVFPSPPPPPMMPNSTLPEPAGPPPPPPVKVIKDKEPIYESVIPRPGSEPPLLFSCRESEMEPEAPLPPLPSAVTSPAQTESPSVNDSCISPTPLSNGDATSTERSARRKERVERRLHQLEAPVNGDPTLPADASDLTEFAKLCFNDHPRSPEGTIIATLTRKSKSMELLTKGEMITYHKGNNIPTSHIQLHDPDCVTAAVNIFRPSRGLARYYCGWLRARTSPVSPASAAAGSVTSLSSVSSGARASHCAQWCLDNCRGAAPRQLPPSTVEIAAMRRLGTIVCRFFFLDGRTKAIDVHPADTAAAAAARLADKLGLSSGSRAGWAIYQQRANTEEHMDEFPVSEKVALQLAGLQAQVSLGEPAANPPPPHTRAYYSHPEQCIVLECGQKQEAAWLMAAYSPALASSLAEEPARRAAPAPERARLAAALRSARRALVDGGLLRRAPDLSAAGFLRNTLRRLSKHRVERVRLELTGEQGESYKGFPSSYWCWSRTLPHSLTKLNEAEDDIMSHAGLSSNEGSTMNLASNSSVSSHESDSDDRVSLAQSLLQRCLQKDTLLCELYMQLIKQVALSIAQVPRRMSAPSKEELLCAAARRPMHVRVLLLDGKQHALVFGPAATADHLVAMLREKIGLSDRYALYEVCANSSPAGSGERALGGAERAADVLARWEKAGATAAACRLVFKKRLFLGERPLHTACVAEMELLYYQVLHAVRHDRLPIETDEAVMVAALHAQVVKGECSGGEECAAAAGAQSFTSNWPRALWLAVDARGLTLLRRGSRAALVSHDHAQLLAVSPAPRALLLVEPFTPDNFVSIFWFFNYLPAKPRTQCLSDCICSAGVPDRNPDQGLHRSCSRACVPGGAATRRRCARSFLTPARLVPVLPRHQPPIDNSRAAAIHIFHFHISNITL
ncbi:unnamed protein product [Leptidea sinapis]|uniref:Myosin motor domain-containing protein n=1 Tax=Leptidea sinapis TaxID=189913 RepID=A0A5E4QTF2_9NEOP|nr:unnamed protein product [Leptidea sinapis]